MNKTTYKDFNELSEDEKRDAYEHFLRTKQNEIANSISYLQKYLKNRDEINFIIHDVSDTYTTLSIIVANSVGYEGEYTEISNLTEEIANAMGYEMCDDHDGRLTPKFMVMDTSDTHTLMASIASELYTVLFNKPDHSFNYSKV